MSTMMPSRSLCCSVVGELGLYTMQYNARCGTVSMGDTQILLLKGSQETEIPSN